MKKTFFLYFFSLFIFSFFFYYISDTNNSLITKKKIEEKSCNNLTYDESQNIHPINFKKFDLELKIHEMRKWARINLADSIKAEKVGSFTNRERVKGSVIFKIDGTFSCSLNVTIRSHGDQINHRQGRGLPSLNVKILDGHIFGIVDFILVKPITRHYDNEIFATVLMQELGFLAPRTASVNLSFGSIEQKYIFQERIVKEFLENFNKREGAIFEGDERFVFQEGNNKSVRFVNHRLANENWAKKNINNRIIAETGLSVLNQHGQFHQIEVPKSWVIDYFTISKELGTSDYFKQLPAFDSVMFAINAIGNLSSQDRRFYFNSVTKEFEPIFYDGKPEFFTRDNRLYEAKLSLVKDLVRITKNSGDIYVTNLLTGKVIPSSVTGANDAINLIKEINVNVLQKKIFSRGLLINEEMTKKALDTINLKLSWLKEFNQERVYSVTANLNLPIEAPRSYKSEIKRRILYYGDGKNEFLSCNIYGGNCRKVILSYGDQVKAIGQKLTDKDKNDLIFIGKEKTEKSIDGWRYFQYLKNYKSLEETEIIADEVKLKKIGYIDVQVNRENKSIKIKKSNNNGKAIFSGGSLENWKIEFTDTSPKEELILNDINGLTGCINFFNTKVKNIEIYGEGSKCEDAINFVNVEGSVKNLKIRNSYSDGFDADFSKINFKNILIRNSGNDCGDLSFGFYKIEKISVTNCGDKGLSVGEKSNLNLNKFISKNTTIGLASKDYAKVFSNDVDMNDVEICISAYSKKQEFNGGLVDIKTMKCKNYYKETDIDASSKITIGKTFYENKKQI